MSLRRCATPGATLLAALVLTSGVAFAANGYSDRAGDVEGGSGPDIVSLSVTNTKTKVTFVVRFAKAPPLRVDPREGWVDMLLIGVDAPPLGPRPITPGGEWRGANFGLGTHGPSGTGQMVRLTPTLPFESRRVATFRIVASGSTLTFSIPRRALGNPGWFTFMAAAAREMADEGRGGGVDLAPERGTFRYALTG